MPLASYITLSLCTKQFVLLCAFLRSIYTVLYQELVFICSCWSSVSYRLSLVTCTGRSSNKMLVTSSQLFVTSALFLFSSFSQISQGREKQPRNIIVGMFGVELICFLADSLLAVRNKRAGLYTEAFSYELEQPLPTSRKPWKNSCYVIP